MSPQPTTTQPASRRGYVVLATAVSVFVIIGMLGLAVDLGRLFIIKSEAQAFADSAAILAATKLDGRNTGLTAATNAVTGSVNRYNFNTQTIPTNRMTVEFATSKVGPWLAPASIANAKGYGFVRVTVQPQLSMSFIQSVNAPTTGTVTGQAIGAQIAETFPNGGYMPFTPFALNPADPTGNFGMIPGEEYAFLWPGNVNNKNKACSGNRVNWPQYNFSDNASTEGSDRGYFELQAASAIADAIQGLKQTSPLEVGDIINLTNGQKQAMQSALEARAALDTDLRYQPLLNGSAPEYSGNGMRLVIMPVNGGALSTPPNMVLGFAAFLLNTSYSGPGNETWCAIYMGSRTSGGLTSAYDGAGSYVVRLVL